MFMFNMFYKKDIFLVNSFGTDSIKAIVKLIESDYSFVRNVNKRIKR